MATQLELWNQALTFLQQPMMQSTETSTPNEAWRLLNAGWRSAAKQAIEAGNWDFAIKRGTFARIGQTPAYGYDFYYQIPADCARLVFVSQTGNKDEPMHPGTWEVDGSKFATSAETVYARWVSYDAVSQPGIWSETFLRYAAAELAIRCIKLNSGQMEFIMKERSKVTDEALSLDAVQHGVTQRKPGTWSTANRRRSRGGASGSGLPEQQA